jgi:hypothetical protein
MNKNVQKINCPNQDKKKRKKKSQEESEKLQTQVADYEQEIYEKDIQIARLQNEKELLLHATVRSKPHSNSLQTNNGFHAISVHHSRYGAEQKIQRIKGCKSMFQIQKDEAV